MVIHDENKIENKMTTKVIYLNPTILVNFNCLSVEMKCHLQQ